MKLEKAMQKASFGHDLAEKRKMKAFLNRNKGNEYLLQSRAIGREGYDAAKEQRMFEERNRAKIMKEAKDKYSRVKEGYKETQSTFRESKEGMAKGIEYWKK